ncbi:hypothetical protein [Oerskovia paurometabola]|uniref:hypothetical protein n=1 Tax=Oerskovia paurometabola TaxID=162170 RepID=UPI00343D67CC
MVEPATLTNGGASPGYDPWPRIDTTDQFDALPIGGVCVDPFDEKGDAPVVICKNARGLWQAMGEPGVALTAEHVAHASKGRLIAVYVPGRDLAQEAHELGASCRDGTLWA